MIWLDVTLSMTAALMGMVVGYFIGLHAKELSIEDKVLSGILDIGGIKYVVFPASTGLTNNVSHTHDPSHTAK